LQEATAFELQFKITQFLRLSLDCRIINSCFTNLSVKKLLIIQIDMKFQEKVWQEMKKIPKGKVATYGQLAKLAGNPKAGRAVGILMRVNPDAPHTPCHRVVASDGSLTGYSGMGGIRKKKEMLVSEGVKFKREKVDMKFSQWKLI
jgi:O-6-methylguanine DNA methyltransferase